jgi:hypothetical protein
LLEEESHESVLEHILGLNAMRERFIGGKRTRKARTSVGLSLQGLNAHVLELGHCNKRVL